MLNQITVALMKSTKALIESTNKSTVFRIYV